MKKTFVAILALVLSSAAGAQTMYDAISYSQNNYSGTARSMALGNAMTAVGGDLGSISINPAGSAVAGYSQFTISPGLNLSTVNAAFSPSGDKAFGPGVNTGSTRMTLPNIGIILDYSTGNNYGVKSFTFGFLCNQANNYNERSVAYGNTPHTSMFAEFASAACGISEDALKAYASFNNSDIPWDLLAAYQASGFTSYGDEGLYAANTELLATRSDKSVYHYVPGNLAQTSEQVRFGSKNDIVINTGMNISDRCYLGFNIGIPYAHYSYDEHFSEAPVNPSQFPIVFNVGGKDVGTYFQSGGYNYTYNASVSGIYAKLGAIVLPTDNLRIGLAVQTPSLYIVKEEWQYGASSVFQDSSFNDGETSPVGSYSYDLRTPYVVDFGLAWTFGQLGLVSVDYELADYSIMRFTDHDINNVHAFRDLNSANRNFCGLAHNIRAGLEFRVLPILSLRAGATMATTPERHWINSQGKDVNADGYLADFSRYDNHILTLVSPSYYKDKMFSFSLGAGYSSPGSFFADFALRLTSYPSVVTSPYFDYDNYDASGSRSDVQVPFISRKRNVLDAVLTFGWRF